jgi:hypothetical protein
VKDKCGNHSEVLSSNGQSKTRKCQNTVAQGKMTHSRQSGFTKKLQDWFQLPQVSCTRLMTCLASSNGSCSSSPSCKGQCSILKIDFNALNCLPKCSKLNSRQTVKCTMLRETFISNKAGRLHTGTHATGRTSRNIDFVKNLKTWHYLIESKWKQITWELSWN